MTTLLTMTTQRDTLMPPPVLPAQAPMNMSKTSTVLLAAGQRLKSVVANPVVVMMVETWKAAWVKASKAVE